MHHLPFLEEDCRWLSETINTRWKVDNKACAEQPMLNPLSELSEPHSCPLDHIMPTNEAKMVNLAYLAAHGSITPLNYKEAIQCPQSAEWSKAMEEKFDNHTHRKTWELVPLPKDQKTIESRWTYVIKLGPDRTVSCYKVWLIAQGFSQAIGIDYNDTFTPTVWLETLWALFHLTVAYGWSCGQDNVIAAFLHGNLDETIYMCQPERYNNSTGCVARLLCSIYGLKQAMCIWNKLMHQNSSQLDMINSPPTWPSTYAITMMTSPFSWYTLTMSWVLEIQNLDFPNPKLNCTNYLKWRKRTQTGLWDLSLLKTTRKQQLQ